MANEKISELPALTSAQLADGDIVPVVDVSNTVSAATGRNSRTTIADLKAVADGRVAVHTSDTTDAHAASAITFTPAGGIAATNVQSAIVEAVTDAVATAGAALDAHLVDTSDAHDASAISFAPTATVAATDVQAAIAEVDAEHIANDVLTTNGDILTRAAGVPARITRADLAADTAFSSRFAPLDGSVAPPYTSIRAPEMTGAVSNTGVVPIFSMSASVITTTTGRIPYWKFAGWATFGIDLRYLDTSSGAGGLVFRIEYKWMGDGDTSSSTTSVDVTVTHAASAGVEHVYRHVSSVPVTAGKDLSVRVYRLATDAADTLADIVEFIGLDFVRQT